MVTRKIPLYRVHYYENDEESIRPFSFRKTHTHVFAMDEYHAREYVKNTVDDFDGFTDEYVGTPPNSVEKVDYKIAYRSPHTEL